MKNLSKIFLAVAVACASFACTTDTTEDLGVAVGGQTQITISLEESRTQLGTEADGVYPLYWSNGDKISVNGVESNEISVGEKASVASFTIPATLSAPYCIAYPAAAEGQVMFAAAQTHVSNTTFGSALIISHLIKRTWTCEYPRVDRVWQCICSNPLEADLACIGCVVESDASVSGVLLIRIYFLIHHEILESEVAELHL